MSSQITKQQKEKIIRLLENNDELPEGYRDLLFPNQKKEYELVYAGKERKEDIISETMAVPFQKVRAFGQNGKGWTNKLIFGDNLQILKEIYNDQKGQDLLGTKDKIKLIYIDPPFATKQDFMKNGEKVYQDKVIGSEFLEFLRERLILAKEILADDGSIYVHLDQKKGHYAKVILDEVFGENNFIREIIWNRMNPSGGKAGANNWIYTHDVIYFYSQNSDNKLFNKQYDPYSKEYIEQRFVHKDKKGRYRLQGNDNRKQYLLDSKGKAITSVWDIANINVMALERTDYPTQKPEALMERIIKASSNEGDIVMDFFAG